MDCVGCDKCRLWGKVQVSGLAAALKILFELDESTLNPTTNPGLLTRQEIVALFNTLHRFSESLHAVELFRGIYKEKELEGRVEREKDEKPPRIVRLTLFFRRNGKLSLFLSLCWALD